MNSIKIMHMADAHLGLNFPFLGALSDRRRMEILDAFGRLCDMCNQLDIDIFLIAGDFLESSCIDPSYMEEVKRHLKRVKAEVILVAGNHDYLSFDSYYLDDDFLENVKLFKADSLEKYTIDRLKTNIYGASFTGYYQREGFLSKPIGDLDQDYINICLVHGDLGQKDSLYNPISMEEVKKKGFDYLALGHIHKTSPIGHTNGGYYSYPGSFQSLSFGDQGKNSVVLANISKNSKEFSYLEIEGPRLISLDFDISAYETNYQLVESLRKTLDKDFSSNDFPYQENYYRITLVGRADRDLSIDKDIIASGLQDLKFLDLIDNSKKDINLDLEARQTNLYGVFIRNYLDEKERLEKEGKSRELKILDRSLDLTLKAFEGRKL